MFPTAVGTADCVGSGCDTAFGSFGGVCAGCVPAGTYIIGSINFDTSGALAGFHNILNFLRAGIDGVTDKKLVTQPVRLTGAIFFVLPEPGTASLLGLGVLGVLGLCAIARRRR